MNNNLANELADVCNAFNYHPTPGSQSGLACPDRVLQLITYGAPGTGKSHRTRLETDQWKDNVFRTTFHPDSDYSTFVGAYKPTMKSEQRINCIDDKAKLVKDGNGNPSIQNVIAYDFVPQAFIKAYVAAWQKMNAAPDGGAPEPVFLVIEEINRGNCAQIFGDLFQLLDRADNGYSDYPIDADTDLMWFLSRDDQLGKQEKICEDVRTGKKLVLPPNFYIRATMNTSDQSLFPIDSAFKRRWDWEYVPILEGKDVNGNLLGWKIAFKYPDPVNLGQELIFDCGWWDFLQKVNWIIGATTKSEDKKLGYFFVKADDNKKISAKKFLEKVIFYLWNDVFKDYGLDKIFADENGKPVEFTRFFDAKTGEIDNALIKEFIDHVMSTTVE